MEASRGSGGDSDWPVGGGRNSWSSAGDGFEAAGDTAGDTAGIVNFPDFALTLWVMVGYVFSKPAHAELLPQRISSSLSGSGDSDFAGGSGFRTN